MNIMNTCDLDGHEMVVGLRSKTETSVCNLGMVYHSYLAAILVLTEPICNIVAHRKLIDKITHKLSLHITRRGFKSLLN